MWEYRSRRRRDLGAMEPHMASQVITMIVTTTLPIIPREKVLILTVANKKLKLLLYYYDYTCDSRLKLRILEGRYMVCCYSGVILSHYFKTSTWFYLYYLLYGVAHLYAVQKVM